MKLTELKSSIDSALLFEKHPEEVDVVIDSEVPYMTVGARPSTNVKFASMGFDWEAGQFRIAPTEKLMQCKHDVPWKVLEWNEGHYCPKCEHRLSGKRINEDIRFCSRCGQAVKWE